jgi:hypothetical protein
VKGKPLWRNFLLFYPISLIKLFSLWNPIFGFLASGPTYRILERLPVSLKIDELLAKMNENSVKMDKFRNTLTETKEVLLILTSKIKPTVAAKGPVNLNFWGPNIYGLVFWGYLVSVCGLIPDIGTSMGFL